MVRKSDVISARIVRMGFRFAATCFALALALAGCPTAVQTPPAVSFTTEPPMIEIPALMEEVAMSSVTLPAAIGGSGELTYSLKPEIPGLAFAASTRVLSGTPTAAGSYSMTYTATDTGDVTASLSFTITVQAAPPPLMIDPAPTAADVADGAYLAAVLGGDANDALTVDGAAALAEDVFTDDQVAALLAAVWWETPAELAAASPAYGVLLAALVAAYDKHLPPAMHTVTLRETALPDEDDPFIPPIDLTTLALGAAHVGALVSQPAVEQTESCYLSVDEATAALGSSDPAAAQRVASCITFSGPSLSPMQAGELVRTCAGGGCSGEAGRQVLAALGATVLHGLIDSMAQQLIDMVIAKWLMGWYVGVWWEDDDDDGIGELREYVRMHILEDSAGFKGFFRDDGELELAVDTELGPWIHRRTSSGGEFVSGEGRLHYEYLADRLGLSGGAPDHNWWMLRIGDEFVGTWSGMNGDGTYTLEIDGRGAVVLTVSGEVKHGWIEPDQHLRDDDRGNFILDDRGFPVFNGCGDLVMLFPEADEVQEWRYCLEDDHTVMDAEVPPFDPDEEWDLNLQLIRQ